MPRPRSQKYRDLPEGLYFKGVKGYVFHRVDDSWKSLGRDKSRAIALARRYNATYRIDPELVHPIHPHQISARNRKAVLPFSRFLNQVVKRYRDEETPTAGTLADFNNKIKKLSTVLGDCRGISIGLEEVNMVLDQFAAGKSNNVYNRWISFMEKVFAYAVDESVMIDNPASRKKRKPKEDKQRKRLTLDEYRAIRNLAPPWLQIAMDLSLETTHAVNEICRIRYQDYEVLDQPRREGEYMVYGFLRIHRQKVKDKQASRVMIPVTDSLRRIIEASRADDVSSPYVVHRCSERSANTMSDYCDHPTQVNKKYLSRQFSRYRDKAGVKQHLPACQRPTFHEIRGLSIHMYDQAGYDPQARAAHTDARSTAIYKAGHVQWIQVPAAEIALPQ
ncbi:tyrosine-type recombinase/integrase [Vibrio mangrovi]|uniref:Phage integrase family protein n=1 Tax=Vibrio mangrovi TaxID=474394 RepID=A0A1Y6IWX8_9VIBR|nr:tyrosine-type recombinase/integrase [Vibrio mangrovi]MDW6004701.1 tyrosine-type recombinase/integrase [Vibrio mangrovi]SMS00992.1 Phage integrase family protein [Vibrio mangrovi]